MWKRILMITALGGLVTRPCAAQDELTKSIIAQYPNDKAVLWNRSEHVEIADKDGTLVAHSNTVEETMILDEQVIALHNTSSFYHSSFRKLDQWNAVTLVPQGNKYKEVKATQSRTKSTQDESVFYDDTKETEVTFPSLVKYGRTRLEYSIDYPDIHFLSGFYFQSHLPIHEASFSVTVPKSVKLGYLMQGQQQQLIKMSTEEGRKETTYTWKVTNMPKTQRFSDGPETPYYVPHVLIYVASYTPRHSNEPVPVFSKTEDLYRYYYPFVSGINKVPGKALEQTVDSAIKGATTPYDKAARIYQWVQHNIRYIAFEDGMGGFIPREAASICSRRYGDCKDMSSLLVAMCRYAGLEAHFTWIGTRSKPYTYEQVPLPITDNHMIAAIKLGNDYIFMDGTDPMIPFGIPPAAIQGKEALIAIDAQQYKIIKVPELEYSKNTLVDSTHLALAGSEVKGEVSMLYTGYPAWNISLALRYRNLDEQKVAIKSLTRRGSDKFQQSSYTFTPEKGINKDLFVRASFSVDGYARKVGNEWYVNMHLQRDHEDDFADTVERKLPIVYRFKNDTKEIVTLDIPVGYVVDYLPSNKEEKVPGLWSYRIRYEQTANQVRLIKDFQQYTLNITPAQFNDHNRMVEDLRREYKESIVLKAKP